MGKHKNDADKVNDFEINVLISKCNVCHSNLDNDNNTSNHDCCKRNGNLPKGGE